MHTLLSCTHHAPSHCTQFFLPSKIGEGFARLSVSDIIGIIKRCKVPKGLHLTDPLRHLVKPIAHLWAIPLYYIWNRILETENWPRAWKTELTSFIVKNKKKPVEKLKDLRPVVLTPIWSKMLEAVLRQLAIEDLDKTLHPDQYGGMAGVSTDMYLAGLVSDLFVPSEMGNFFVNWNSKWPSLPLL